MQKSKVIEVLKTFSQDEMKSFRAFIHSPFHNSNKNVKKLFEIIKKYYPGFISVNLAKEKIFSKLYPGKKYSDIVMRILISDILRLSEEYLAYKKYSSEYLAEKAYLLAELRERKLGTLFNGHLREAEEYLNTNRKINSTYFLDKFGIEQAKVDYLISSDKQDRSTSALVKQGEHLVNFFMMNGFNLLQEQLEHKEVLNKSVDFNLLEIFLENLNSEDVMKKLKDVNYIYLPVLKIYYSIFKFYENIKSDENYYGLRDLITANLNQFDAAEKYNLLLALESCAVSRLNLGIANAHEDLSDVYELMLSKNAFTESDRKYMQANLFRNIFYNSVILKKYEWAENFIKDYTEYLVPDQKPDMFNYTSAVLNYEKKNYGVCLEYVSKINYSFFIFKYDAKCLMLKVYYETKSFDSALSLIDSFEHFISKNKTVAELYKEQFHNFLKYVKQLINYRIEGNTDKFSRYEVLKLVENEERLINKRWVLEKIKEL